MQNRAHQESLTLAFWDTPVMRTFAEGLEGRPFGWDLTIRFESRAECDQLLRAGLVDIALVATVEALSQPETYAVLPAVAFSSWKSEAAGIRLEQGLSAPVDHIAFSPEYAQEALLSRIVLKEHYQMQPVFKPDANATEQQNCVRVGGEPSFSGGIELDLGQEWFELTNYPMVWGVFAVRPGEGNRQMVDLLRDAAATWEHGRAEIEEPYLSSEPRFRLDDIATASLTELCDLLFFYEVTSEIPPVAFADIQEEQRNDPTEDDDEEAWPGGVAE